MRETRSLQVRRLCSIVSLVVAASALVWSCDSSNSLKSAIKVTCILAVTGSSPSDTTIRVGDQATVLAVYESLNRTCDTVKYDPPNWISDNTSVLAVLKLTSSTLVPQHAQITGLAPGIAHVSTGVGQATTVTVVAIPNTITVAPPTTVIQIGQGVDLTATVRNGNGNIISGAPISWQTANASIASIPPNSTGSVVHVTGVLAGGPVAVTATSGAVSASAQINVAGSAARIGYALADQPSTPSYTAAQDKSFSSGGQPVRIDHTATGKYTVSFDGLQAPNGPTETVLVTPVGNSVSSGATDCRLFGNWTNSASTLAVNVECSNRGVVVDSRFSILVLGAYVLPGRFAFTVADQPSAAQYTPAAATTFSSTSQPVTITHGAGAGVYNTVFFSGQQRAASSDREAQLVTAMGTQTPEHCSSDPDFTTGNFMAVRCATFDGTLVDAQFTAALIGTGAARVIGIARTIAPNGIVTSASFNQAGPAPTVSGPAGSPDVTFPGLGPVVGSAALNVQINAQAGPGRCYLNGAQQSWTVVGADLVVHVLCFDGGGVLSSSIGYTVVVIH